LPVVGHAKGVPDKPEPPPRVLTDDEQNRAKQMVKIIAEYNAIMIKLRSPRFKQLAGKKRGWAIRKFLLGGDPKIDRLTESQNRETAEKLEAVVSGGEGPDANTKIEPADTGGVSEDTPEMGSEENAEVTPDHRGNECVRKSTSEEQSNG